MLDDGGKPPLVGGCVPHSSDHPGVSLQIMLDYYEANTAREQGKNSAR